MDRQPGRRFDSRSVRPIEPLASNVSETTSILKIDLTITVDLRARFEELFYRWRCTSGCDAFRCCYPVDVGETIGVIRPTPR